MEDKINIGSRKSIHANTSHVLFHSIPHLRIPYDYATPLSSKQPLSRWNTSRTHPPLITASQEVARSTRDAQKHPCCSTSIARHLDANVGQITRKGGKNGADGCSMYLAHDAFSLSTLINSLLGYEGNATNMTNMTRVDSRWYTIYFTHGHPPFFPIPSFG